MSVKIRRAIRTALQAAVGVAPFLPAIVAAPGVADALPWLAGAAVTAGTLARVMATPAVERLLDLFGIGLVADDGSGDVR